MLSFALFAAIFISTADADEAKRIAIASDIGITPEDAVGGIPWLAGITTIGINMDYDLEDTKYRYSWSAGIGLARAQVDLSDWRKQYGLGQTAQASFLIDLGAVSIGPSSHQYAMWIKSGFSATVTGGGEIRMFQDPKYGVNLSFYYGRGVSLGGSNVVLEPTTDIGFTIIL